MVFNQDIYYFEAESKHVVVKNLYKKHREQITILLSHMQDFKSNPVGEYTNEIGYIC